MDSSRKLPATVITGFLGAGKTTLIRHLIAYTDRRIALIINEFGDVGVDGEILKSCSTSSCGVGDIVELANGCICCTVADDFIPTMTALIERPDPPDHIVIETSGLALPQPLIKAFNWPEIRTRVTVDGVVTVVDGAALAGGQVTGDLVALNSQRAEDPSLDHDDPIEETFADQLAAADIVVMTKSDLISNAEATRAKAHLSGLVRDGVRVVGTAQGAVGEAVLIGLGARAELDLDGRTGLHGEGEDHDHDDFETIVVDLSRTSSREALEAAARRAIESCQLLRLKGFAAIDGHDMRLVIQTVGPRIDSWFDRAFKPGEARETRLVAIGLKGLDAHALRAALAGP